MQNSTADFTGLSGRSYSFLRYDRIPRFKTRLSCVYCLARRVGPARLKMVYVGQTEDFNRCFGARPSPPLNEGDFLFILPINDANSRAGIHADMLMGLYRDDSRAAFPAVNRAACGNAARPGPAPPP